MKRTEDVVPSPCARAPGKVGGGGAGRRRKARRARTHRHVVLRRRRARNHDRRRVLDLHLVEEHVAVLGQLDLAGAVNEHLQRPARAWRRGRLVRQDGGVPFWRPLTEVRPHDLCEPSRRLHIDGQRLGAPDHLCIWIHELQTKRGSWGETGDEVKDALRPQRRLKAASPKLHTRQSRPALLRPGYGPCSLGSRATPGPRRSRHTAALPG